MIMVEVRQDDGSYKRIPIPDEGIKIRLGIDFLVLITVGVDNCKVSMV